MSGPDKDLPQGTEEGRSESPCHEPRRQPTRQCLQGRGLFGTGSQQCRDGSAFPSNRFCREERHSELEAGTSGLPLIFSYTAHTHSTDTNYLRRGRCSGLESCSPHVLSRKSGGSSTPPCKGEGSHICAHFLQLPILGGGASQPPQIPSSFHMALFSQVPHRVWGDLSLRPASPSHINMRTPLL